MTPIKMCDDCGKFQGTEEIPETEKYICKLCEIRIRVPFDKYDNDRCYFYTPNSIKKIITFDDGNQKYENEPNQWLKIGHWREHPEKIILINNTSNAYISSISNWKVSTIYD